MTHSQNMILSLTEEKRNLEKKLQKFENEEKRLKEEIYQLKQKCYLLEEEKKNAEAQYNSVFNS